MKKILVVMTVLATAALYSCGGHSSSSESNNNEPVSNAETPAPAMANSSPSIDINAKSDSKGVGDFTHVKIGKFDPALAAKGQTLFENKCTACHKPTDETLVGPGLKGVTKIRTPEWIMNMMTNPSGMIDKDPVAKALLDQFHTEMTFQNVTDQDARAIYEYLRQNDGAQ